MECVEKNARYDLRQASTSKSEREGVQGGSETSNVVNLYGLETVALTKRQESEMEVAELKMLRFALGVTRMDKITNEYIRGTAQVGQFGEKTRSSEAQIQD